jgi:hypothetical protein
MKDLSHLAYAKLNINYNKELFVEEYDKYILPDSVPIVSGRGAWASTREINKHWGMVSEDIYDLSDYQEKDGSIVKRGYPTWQGTSLVFVDSQDDVIRKTSYHGSVGVRNTYKDQQKYSFKEKFSNLEIVKFIKSLPIKDIIGVRCVSLPAGTYATIHRDANGMPGKLHLSSIMYNHLWKDGFISITLNLTNGGQPLFYSVDSNENQPLLADDPCYMFNDYFWHGVPVVDSRRRQIRITAKPDKGFYDLIDADSAVNH